MARFTLAAAVATRYRSGPGFLVGDAAHRTTPVAGIGLNTAVHDGHELGWKLAWVARGLAGEALLDSHDAERGPVGLAAAERSLDVEGRPTDGLASDLGHTHRSAVIDGAGSPPELRIDLAARPGERAPHAWVRHSGRRVSTLDVFDGRLTLVTGDDTGWARAAGTFGLQMLGRPAARALARAYRLGPDWRCSCAPTAGSPGAPTTGAPTPASRWPTPSPPRSATRQSRRRWPDDPRERRPGAAGAAVRRRSRGSVPPLQHQQRAGRDPEPPAGLRVALLAGGAGPQRVRGVHDHLPHPPVRPRSGSVNVDAWWWALNSSRNESSMIALAERVALGDAVAVEEDGQRRGVAGVPVVARSSAPRPGAARRCRSMLDAAVIGRPWKNRRRRKTGWSARSSRPVAGELGEHRVSRASSQSTQLSLVVLAVDVVVAALGAAELVAVREHRHALGQQQRGDEVALLPLAQRVDLAVVGRALDAAVPRPVVALAVAVVLAVGVVVLLVVGDEVGAA